MNSNRIFALTGLSLALALTACSGDDTSTPTADGGTDAGKDGSVTSDTGAPQGDAAADTGTVPVDGGGAATFTLSADKKTLSYHLTHNVTGASAAHIHLGGGGEAGGVVYPLTFAGGDTKGDITITAADLANLEAGLFYANVHSPGAGANGEIRGQILRPGEKLYVAKLSGAEETPPVISTASASAAVILDAAKANIRYHLVLTGITPTAAHIHKGLATEAGAVVIPLTPVGAKIDGTAAVTADQATDLAEGHFYANVHTALNSNGEIRGQLMLPGEVLYSASMKGTSEVPPNASAATGNAQFILDYAKASLRYEGKLTGITATQAHIHTGAVGVSGGVLHALTLAAPGFKGTVAVTAADVTALDAKGLYANAHSAAFADGEIRGQIAKP
jgi:hypothetical protein